MKYYTQKEVERLQAGALESAHIRRKEEEGFLIEEFRSYRCHACLALCGEDEYFHDFCAEMLINGHSVECVSHSLYPDHNCICGATSV